MDFEYIVRGYMFRKGRMKITVSKIFKVILALVSVVREGMICESGRIEIFCAAQCLVFVLLQLEGGQYW